jgi:hypothetical protein
MGRAEIRRPITNKVYDEQEWGTICSHKFNQKAAVAFCKGLSLDYKYANWWESKVYTGIHPLGPSHRGREYTIEASDIWCVGTEKNIDEC